MSRRATFGIVGAYGATGRVVVSELLRSADGDLLIGGRDSARIESFAAELGSRASAAVLDVVDAGSLSDFCSRCSIVVNCGGPVLLLQDRVAQAAFRARCHYVDSAGMSVVKERLLPHAREIWDLGMSFVVSAGWTPGLTELLPVHAYAQARTRMDSIESVTVYFSDSGEWSESALRDGVSYIRQAGLSKPAYFRNGESVSAKASEASRKFDLGDPIGSHRFSLFTMPELSEAGRRLTDCDFLTYSYVSGFRTVAAAVAIALLPLSEQACIRLLRNIFKRNRLAVAGFVVADVAGRSAGRGATLRSCIAFDAGRDYWTNGVTLATTARMIAGGRGVRSGVNFLFDAVDPIAFMAELREAGVEQSENFDRASG